MLRKPYGVSLSREAGEPCRYSNVNNCRAATSAVIYLFISVHVDLVDKVYEGMRLGTFFVVWRQIRIGRNVRGDIFGRVEEEEKRG